MAKKIFFILFPLFSLCLFLAKYSFALDASPTPPPPLINLITPNPGPPIGIPCGKTMCLETEFCTTYPNEADPHCVPNPLAADPTLPKDCYKELQVNHGVFPTNSLCWNHIRKTQKDLSLYTKSCVYEPIITYSDKRTLNGGSQPFSKCGKGNSGPGGPAAPGGSNPECDVFVLANTDVRDAQLGSYGPDAAAADQYSVDFLAQNYLYDSLFGRPNNLSSSYDPNNAALNDGYPTREAYRTYWRLLPAANQANLRSFVLNMANDKQIDNIQFKFTDLDKSEQTTDFLKLYNILKAQVILFWHFPFVRVGCLTSYPVCPEYAQAIKELRPPTDGFIKPLTDLAKLLQLDPLVTGVIQGFNGALSLFGFNIDGPYEAFVPLEFDSVRSYIVLKDKDDEEIYFANSKLIDNTNAPRYGTNKPPLNSVSREHLPYVQAIHQGLLSPKFGMIPALKPQWMVDIYAKPGGSLSDYKMGNAPKDFPEIKIAQKNILEQIQDEADAFLTNPFGWITNKVISFFNPATDNLKGYTDNIPGIDDPMELALDNPNDAIIDQYVNMQSCPMPVSYHLVSPKTVAKSPFDHHQVVTIKGNELEWNYTPQCSQKDNACYKDPDTGLRVCEPAVCRVDDEHYEENGQCCTRAWTVSGVKHGKALTVLNNPKQTDIKNAVAGDSQISFYDMLLPNDNAIKITDAQIDAPIAKHVAVDGGQSTAPNGTGAVTNPAESIMRENNLAQDSMHFLQNCWTVPGDLQNSPRCSTGFPATLPPVGTCNGEAFAKIAPNPDAPSSQAQSYFSTYIQPLLTPEVISAYAAAETQTGVPCEVLAGIHFEEGSNNPNQSLQDGRPLNGKTLTQSAIQAAEELKNKAGGAITDLNTLIKALSWYNGGGNSNCQAASSYNCPRTVNGRCGARLACDNDPAGCICGGGVEAGSCRSSCTAGFPWKFSYPHCPPQTTGYDDPYVTNWWKSPEHDTMYLLYIYDCTQTEPRIHGRPGSLTVAISLFLSEQNK